MEATAKQIAQAWSDTFQQHNLLSTATHDEQTAFIERNTDAYNRIACPVLESRQAEVTRHNVSKLLAAAFVDRVRALGMKGQKTLDNAALEFFCGAAVAYNLAGQRDLSEAVRVALAFNIAIRGYKAVQELAAEQMTKESVALNVSEARSERKAARSPRRDPDHPDTPSLQDQGIYPPSYSS